MDKRLFWVLFALVLLTGFYLRFYDITNRPMHHDEGVIGWFKMNILDACLNRDILGNPLEWARACGASYGYNPDYHGPFEYLFGAWMFKIFGASDFTLRAPECLFNLGTILLLLPLRKKLGDAGTLTAGALLAVSPSMVYYAQRAYMDNFFIFFTLAAVVCAFKFWEERKSLWLYLGAADLALLFTTKETAFIFVFSGATFFAVEILWAFITDKGVKFAKMHEDEKKLLYSPDFIVWVVISILIFAIVYAFVFSTMFTDPGEVWNGITKGLTFWLERSSTWEGHFKPFYYYYDLFTHYEQAILFLSVAVVLFSLRNSFARWCAWWAVSTIVIFSYIQYKTPWLDPHMLLPMALVAGIGIDALVNSLHGRQKLLPFLVIVPLLALSTLVAWDITYVKYADGNIALVYVSGVDSYKVLVQKVENLSARMDGTNTEISVVSTDYWPLPWSMRDYKRAAWFGRSVPDQTAPIIISSKNDFSEIKEELRSQYAGPESYDLRPGATVYLYYRRG